MHKVLGPMRAEFLKIMRNYKTTAFLVWIFPIGIVTFYTIMIVFGLLSSDGAEDMVFGCDGQWTESAMGVWDMISVFPGSIFGRVLPLAFFAVVFAGEYQWGTWKNLVPRTRRLILFLSKCIVATLTVVFTILLMAPISSGGQALLCKVGEVPYGPAFSAEVLQSFAWEFSSSSLIGFLALLMTLGFAALASVLSRSILGGFLGGFGFSMVETMALGLLVFIRNLFNIPEIINLYRFAPVFNLDNLRMWFFQGHANQGEFVGMTVTYSVGQSLAVMTVWILLPLILAILFFQRQDLTT